MKAIVWLDEVGKGDVALAGGKGANLGELTKAGIPVPPAFIVTTDAYFRFLREAGLRERLREVLDGLDPDDPVALQRASAQARQLVRNAPMPDALARAIADAYRRLGGGPVAVRSSATAEDTAEASFAGQQATFLNVEGEEAVVRAVQELSLIHI